MQTLKNRTEITSFKYGLEATDNSKAGPSFALPPEKVCGDVATTTCKHNCYKKSVRYNTAGSIGKRERNFQTVERLLELGGPQLLAKALIELIDEYKPKDWFVAQATGGKTSRPWSFRIHDLGEFYRTEYIEAWLIAVSERPLCQFWFYTRAFKIQDRYKLLSRLAALANCQGWLSIDADNWMAGVSVYRSAPKNLWKLALLQTPDLPESLLIALRKLAKRTDVVNFPLHRGPHHIAPLKGEPVMNCPEILGAFTRTRGRESLRPCPRCQICLPANQT
jgi:hypothetical protein